MKNLLKIGIPYILGSLTVFALLGGISWITICGLVKLITMCFGWKFTWAIGTGVWLCLCLLSTVMPKSK